MTDPKINYTENAFEKEIVRTYDLSSERITRPDFDVTKMSLSDWKDLTKKMSYIELQELKKEIHRQIFKRFGK